MIVYTGFIIGFLFGFIVHRGGLVRYSRILGSFLLRDLKAINFMFHGMAVAGILYSISYFTDMGINPRINGYFGSGHIIGGIIFGLGLSLSGFCPGACVARFSSGKRETAIGLLGMVAGVAVYDIFYPFWSGLGGKQKFITWMDITGISYGYLALVFGLFFSGLAFYLDRIDPSKKFDKFEKDKPFWEREWGWFLTGTMAGLLIFSSTAFGGYISFSSGFLTLTGHTADLFGIKMQSLPSLTDDTLWRALLMLGVFPGAYASSRISKTFQKNDPVTPLFAQRVGGNQSRAARLIFAFTGGFMTILGAQIGGGCTTGAFMSAWPTLSVGSFLMGTTFFLAGVLGAHLVYFKKWNIIFAVKEKFKLTLSND